MTTPESDYTRKSKKLNVKNSALLSNYEEVHRIKEISQLCTKRRPGRQRKDFIPADDIYRPMTLGDILAHRILSGDILIVRYGKYAVIRVKVIKQHGILVNVVIDRSSMIKLAPYNLLARKKGKSIVINISIPSIGDLTLGRFLLEVEDPSVKVFHINKDILDFRISNLEAVIKGGKRTRLEKPKKRKKKQIKGNRPSNRYRGIWRTVRLQVLDRAKGICEICRRRKVDDVHHKMPVRFFKKPSHAHTLENLLAVCKQCHRKEHKLIREKLPLFNIMLHA